MTDFDSDEVFQGQLQRYINLLASGRELPAAKNDYDNIIAKKAKFELRAREFRLKSPAFSGSPLRTGLM